MMQWGALTPAAVTAAGAAAGVRSTSVQDVMRRLLQRKNIMVRPPGPSAAIKEAKYIAAIDILQVHSAHVCNLSNLRVTLWPTRIGTPDPP